MKAVTQWFPCTEKPVHVGFYQREWWCDQLTEAPDYWDGKRWHIGGTGVVSGTSLPWRGLAEKP